MVSATEDRLYNDPDLAQFYDLESTDRSDFEFCLRLAAGARSVLDLGCGTGELAARLAPDRDVAGVDPAAPMLDVARSRPGGNRVAWVEADARTVRLGRRFDLVFLTGHAFQVFLTADDQRAVLRTISDHLSPQGRFIFDTRNPAAEEWLEWVPEQSVRLVDHAEFGKVRAWNDVAFDARTGVATYETHYEALADGRRFSAASKIAFLGKDDLAALLAEEGLAVDQWLGDWQGNLFEPGSAEIIPVGRLR